MGSAQPDGPFVISSTGHVLYGSENHRLIDYELVWLATSRRTKWNLSGDWCERNSKGDFPANRE